MLGEGTIEVMRKAIVGKTWVHENNGETYREAFTYELSKV